MARFLRLRAPLGIGTAVMTMPYVAQTRCESNRSPAVGHAQTTLHAPCTSSSQWTTAGNTIRPYTPPPRYTGSFAALGANPPVDDAGRLAWCVKYLEIDELTEIFSRWPRGACLIDEDNNTLFHLLSMGAERCEAHPSDTAAVMALLLRNGWDVVDMKNSLGLRTDDATDPKSAVGSILRRRSLDCSEEKLRCERPLQLVGEASPASPCWQYDVFDEQRRSFGGVMKRAVPEETCNRWAKKLLEGDFWMTFSDTPRKTAWFVSEDCEDCPYKYSGLTYPATVYPPIMEEIRAEVCRLCGIPQSEAPNSCNVNTYTNHDDEVGWHSDDEVYFQSLGDDTCILSFSLGAERDFCWRLQGTKTTMGSVALGDGDLMTMEGRFQKHYKHAVPRSDTAVGMRINLTFRWIRVKAHAADASTRKLEQSDTGKVH